MHIGGKRYEIRGKRKEERGFLHYFDAVTIKKETNICTFAKKVVSLHAE